MQKNARVVDCSPYARRIRARGSRRLKTAQALLAITALGCSRAKVTLVADAASGAASTTVPVAPLSPPDLTLFYGSDFRGKVEPDRGVPSALGGLARRAALVDEARAVAKAVLIVDAGNFLPEEGDAGSGLGSETRVLLASYKRMGVNVVTPGENELAIGVARLRKLLRDANLTAVALNLTTREGKPAFDDAPIAGTGASSVGVFGVVELGGESSGVLRRSELVPIDAVETARKATRSLRDRGAATVVGLFHLAGGVARAAEIAREASDIDLVVVGNGSEGESSVSSTVGKTRIVFAGTGGTHVGRIDLRSGEDGGPPRLENHTLALEASIRDQLGVGLLTQIDAERARIAQEKLLVAERRRKGQKEPQVFESWTYGSTTACGFCHQAAVAQWKTTDHARAIATLKKARHDDDPACLGCHTTGYLQPGGTRRVETALEQFGDVGCECCHGPSAEHVRSIDKKKGTSRAVKIVVCLGCHTPDQNLGPFDYDAALSSVLGPGHGDAGR